MGRDGIAPDVYAEQHGPAGARSMQAEQQPDRRGLPGTVRAEIPIHLAASNG
jgi:hypothetical protein